MKVCSHCKTQNNDSANYCRQCGFVFPDVNLQSGNIDNSLVDKVNELQKRVSDAEANSSNSQREINTLNSRVSSLVNSNSSLQNKLTQTERQLSSANNAVNSERQKAQNAQKEADNAKKSLEEAESSKSTLHTFYIIALIALGITALVQFYGKQNNESEINRLKSEKSEINRLKSELESQVKTLKSENSNLSNTNRSLSSVLEKVGSKTPLFLGDVSIRNDGESYGSTIYSSRTTYINPKVEIFSLTDGRVDINVKLYTPYGLSTGTSSSGGYSYSDYFYVSKNQTTTCEFNGWGGTDKGHWSSGNYRFEFYYKGKCIGSKSFTIY